MASGAATTPIRSTVTTLPPVLRLFLTVVFLLGIACIATEFFCSHALHMTNYIYTRPTLWSTDDHADAGMFIDRFHHFHQPSFFDPQGSHFLYPAPNGFIYEFFYRLPHPVSAMLLGIILACCAVTGWMAGALKRRGLSTSQAWSFAAAALVTSYPFFFEFNRGNVEIFIWILAAAGILAFFRDRFWLAATLIGLAGAFKGYPFIYLGLLFARRKYIETAWAVVVGVAFNLFSFWAIAGNYAVGKQGVAAGVDEFRRNYVLRFNATGLDHSIFGFIKRFVTPFPPADQLEKWLTAYLVAATIIACAVYFFRARRMPPINQLIFLTVAAITLPPTSYDYTLIHLYTGWALLVFLAVAAWREGRKMPPGLWAAFLCFMLLLSPQNEIVFHGERLEGQIKCLVLLTLAFVALRFPFDEASARETFASKSLAG